MKVLVVEDDKVIGQSVSLGLTERGFTVDWVRTGADAIAQFSHQEHHVLVLDLGLPDLDGKRVLKTLRGKGIPLPVLVLTARDQSTEVIECLDLGADDYLTKPFHMDILAARIRALSRRLFGKADSVIQQGALTLNTTTRVCSIDGEPLSLSRREFSLLSIFLMQPRVVHTRDALERELFQDDIGVESNSLEVHVHHLRKKLGEHSHIQTIRGIGYRWQSD